MHFTSTVLMVSVLLPVAFFAPAQGDAPQTPAAAQTPAARPAAVAVSAIAGRNESVEARLRRVLVPAIKRTAHYHNVSFSVAVRTNDAHVFVTDGLNQRSPHGQCSMYWPMYWPTFHQLCATLIFV